MIMHYLITFLWPMIKVLRCITASLWPIIKALRNLIITSLWPIIKVFFRFITQWICLGNTEASETWLTPHWRECSVSCRNVHGTWLFNELSSCSWNMSVVRAGVMYMEHERSMSCRHVPGIWPPHMNRTKNETLFFLSNAKLCKYFNVFLLFRCRKLWKMHLTQFCYFKSNFI